MRDGCDGTIGARISRRLGAARSRTIGLRVIPMIDMLFLLVIFFILTGSFTPAEDYLPFVLPKLEGGSGASVIEPLVISIHAGSGSCNVHVGQGAGAIVRERDPEAGLVRFAENLGDVMKRQKRTAGDPIEIVCEEGVEWQYVVKVYDVLYGVGISDITFRMTE